MTTSRKTINSNPFESLKGADLLGEKELTDRFICAVNDNEVAPGLKIIHCVNRPDLSACDKDVQKVNVAFYRTAMTPNDAMLHWADQLIVCEFKDAKRSGAIQDPFDDVPDGIDGVLPSTSEHRKKNQGQIITYAELLFAMQQRTAVFMLLVLGRKCRFIRWDRSGFVVTRAVDYYTKWKFFVNVLWRISQSSDKRLGLDPTAHRLLPGDPDFVIMTEAGNSLPSDINHQERVLGDDKVPHGTVVFSYVRNAFHVSVKDEQWPQYRVEVSDGAQTRSFLVGKPSF